MCGVLYGDEGWAVLTAEATCVTFRIPAPQAGIGIRVAWLRLREDFVPKTPREG